MKVLGATIVLSVELVDYTTACSSRLELDENFQRHMAIMFNSSILWRLLPETSLEDGTRCLAISDGENGACRV